MRLGSVPKVKIFIPKNRSKSKNVLFESQGYFPLPQNRTRILSFSPFEFKEINMQAKAVMAECIK